MKTYLKTLNLALALFLVCNVVNGQKISGTKTIGGTSSDYADINTATSILQAVGIDGDVILNIRDGVYPEKFEVANIPGTDKYSITFQSESQDTAKVKIVYTALGSSDHMVKLTNIKNISFNHISFHYTGYDYTCHMIHMYDDATKIKFENNNFKSFNANSYAIYAPQALSSEASVDTVQISNNKFVSGICGVLLQGGYYGIVDSVVINNNIFLNQRDNGIDLSSCEGVTIKSNEITSTVGEYASVDIFGIGLKFGKNFEISSNNINVNFGVGILVDNCSNTVTLKRLISNNFVTIKPALDGWTGAPMSITSSTYVDIVHNTLRRIGNGGMSKSALDISESANINLVNNIIYNNEALSLWFDSNTGPINSNYNYLLGVDQNFARFNTTTCKTFDEWKTISSLDANSVSGTIAFISDANSHIKISDASNVLIDNKGTQWIGINDDIDNNARNNPPDIGADEFTLLNEAPVISNQTFSIAENSANGTAVGAVEASDADAGQALTYSITAGNTSNAFAINSTTGALTVNTSSVLNYEALTSFALSVMVQDNGPGTKSSTATITVNITNVNEAPVLSSQTFTIAENSTNGTAIGTITGSDPDAGQTLAYSITAGNTSNAFAIDASSGAITVNNASALNYEASASIAITVSAQDNGTGTLSVSATVTVNLTNVNEAPVISNQTFSLKERSADGTTVGTVLASDPDADQTLTYSITAGNELSAFIIDGATGAVTVSKSSALDFTTTPTFALTVTVQDNATAALSGSATITINLTKATGINSLSNNKAINIYPNPSYGKININPELFKEGKVGIEIFDMNGKLILRKENISESEPLEINQTGMFYVNLIVNDKVYSQKIIIRK